MKISKVIQRLKQIQSEHGDIEVTCTASLEPDSTNGLDGKPYESTVENFIIKDEPVGNLKDKRVRLYF
jgi:hypothetical protein